MGEMHWWYVHIQAARYANVPPDWFVDKSVFWLEAVTKARAIDAEVAAFHRGEQSGSDTGSSETAAMARLGIGGYDEFGNIIPLR